MHNVVLFSGGLDSTACLNHVVKKKGAENVTALHISYGAIHGHREKKAAEAIIEVLQVEGLGIKLPISIFEGAGSALLGEMELPDGEYRKDGPQDTVVPFRNGIMLSIATAVSYKYGPSEIWIAAHKDDGENWAYPDCRPEFLHAMDSAIDVATMGTVRLIVPYVTMTKYEIVVVAAKEDAPLELSWSCYAGKERHCGVCATCIDRHNAFRLAGYYDPTEYSIMYNDPRIHLKTYPTLDKE